MSDERQQQPLTKAWLGFLVLAWVGLPATSGAQDWKPIDRQQLAMEAPLVDKEAAAEVLLWEVRVQDAWRGDEVYTELRNYLRIKIFDDRAKESQGQVDLVFGRKQGILDVAARTIKPDGSIIEVKKADVFERTIVRGNGVKVKAKSFALPGVEKGAIVEYRWTEMRDDQVGNYLHLDLQREIPVQTLRYYLRPLMGARDLGYRMRVQWFNAPAVPFKHESDGYNSVELSGVRAFRQEQRMPPENQVRSWLLAFYTEDRAETPDAFWKRHGRAEYDRQKLLYKASDDVKNAAAVAVGDATDPDKRLELLFEFCRSKIRRVDEDASELSQQERKKFKPNRTPAETLKRGMGTGDDVLELFVALASAAGFDARLLAVQDRSQGFFDPAFADAYFLRARSAAVRMAGGLRYLDPSSRHVPYGNLRWQEEGAAGLLLDANPVFVNTPLTPAGRSKAKRDAMLRLAEDGTLEGEVRIEYGGHLAAQRRLQYDQDSKEEREKAVKTALQERLSTAELAEIAMENVGDPQLPLVYRYKVRVPGYAQRTGKRLFLQPAFFHHGAKAMFPARDRKHSVYFDYPWSEEDQVTIELPEGFSLDHADAPASISAAPVADYKVQAEVQGERRLRYRRSFQFAMDGTLLFPVDMYPAVKDFFDRVHTADEHTITLRQAEPGSKPGASGEPGTVR